MATWKRKLKLPWREAGLPNHHDDREDSRLPGGFNCFKKMCSGSEEGSFSRLIDFCIIQL